jgi:hypothetical protein
MATLRQKVAVTKIIENHGNVSKAMKEAGYPPTTYANPSNLTNSKGFRELIDQMGITDEKLIKVLDEGLGATKAVVMGVKSEESFVDVQPDYAIRHKYLETGLKLKGYARDEPLNFNVNFINNVPRPNTSSKLQS